MASDMPLPNPQPPGAKPDPLDTIVVCGFWKRIGAFVVDALILAVPDFLLGVWLYGFVSQHREAAQLIGFGFALAYFGILDSSLGHGQTVGNRLADIQVVDASGHAISPARSCARCLVLGVPWLLGQFDVTCDGQRCALTEIVRSTSFAGGVAIIYLYVFNRKTRQSLHDLVVGTYVVQATPWASQSALSTMLSGAPRGVEHMPTRLSAVSPMWRGHWAVLVVVLLALGPVPAIISQKIARTGSFPELTAVQQAIVASGKVTTTNVAVAPSGREGRKTTLLRVSVRWKGTPPDEQEAAKQIAAIVLDADPQVFDHDYLEVVFIGGFDVGFAHMTTSHPYRHTPQEWQGIIQSGRR